MFGSDRFTFETPNVIDPGDLPPSQPKHQRTPRTLRSSREAHTPSTQSGSDSGSEDEYQEARHSAARLLQDIGDLDLSAAEKETTDATYFDNFEDHSNNHSLPSVEEARTFATALLQDSDRRQSPMRDKSLPSSPFGKTKTLKLPSQDAYFEGQPYLRRRFLKIGCLIIAIVVIVIVSISVASRNAGSPIKSKRHEEVINFLADRGVSSYKSLTTPGEPQYMAANWIADVDPLGYEIPFSLQDPSSRLVQRYVLSTFFFSMMGMAWTHTYNFMTTEDECGWFRARAIAGFLENEYAIGVTCDEQLQVTNIFIPDNGVTGSLPNELQFLPHLTMLALPNNYVTGGLPEALKSLTGLLYLDLSHNDLQGTIPSWIGDFQNLEVLGLSNNRLSGILPASLSTLSRIKTLAIDDNNLSGDVATVPNHLKSLEYFYADRNLFVGDVDDFFLSGLDRLREVDVSDNQLRGTYLPQHLMEHPNLRVLDLADNDLSGNLPILMQQNNVLEFLSLRHNSFSGAIPDSFANFSNLNHLDLHGNGLTGNLPNSMDSMTKLTYLFLGANNFYPQQMPFFLSNLVGLRELSLTEMQLQGAIPTWFMLLTNLQFLDLSNNQLAYDVPIEVWNLPELSYILLNDNMLTGIVPEGIQGSEKLKLVALHRNAFTGGVSHICQEAPDLELLSVDCEVTCSQECCPTCCDPNDSDCFKAETSNYLLTIEGTWEYNFKRVAYSFDPAILAESGIVTLVSAP